MSLRVKLVEELKEQVPDTMSFNIGYIENGQKNNRMWIATNDDICSMYSKYKSGEIVLWCDGRSPDVLGHKRKRDEPSRQQHEREDDVEDVFQELKKKHGEKYDVPKLRLWARMVSSNIHDTTEDPPNIPAFNGRLIKKPRQESITTAISGAAAAIAQVFSGTPSSPCSSTNTEAVRSGISPGKAVELRMKYLEQLRYIQGLLKDNILTENEFREQKESILSALKML